MSKKLLKIFLFSLLFWIPVIIFSKLADDILEHESIFFDKAILEFVHSYSSQVLDNFFLFITNAGSPISLAAITFLICIFLFYKKFYQKLLILSSIVGGSAIANLILKLIFHRDRPSLWNPLIVENGYSFPSGHAMVSSAFVIGLIFILWETKYKWLSLILGAIFVLLIGFSRIYLGVHYPTDIIAGWCVSFVWGLIVNYFVNRRTA